MRSPIRHILSILLTGLFLAGCSGEAARIKTQANQAFAEGRLGEAVLAYRQALLKDPNDPDLLTGLGKALAAQGRDRLAAVAFNQAIIQRPGDPAIEEVLSNLITRPSDGLSLRLEWIFDEIKTEPLGAAADSGKVFVAYTKGNLLALDLLTGRKIWEINPPSALSSPPAAGSGQVWVGSQDGTILVYEQETGQLLGRVPTGGDVVAAPALSSWVAYCPSNDGSLYAIDRKILTLVWKAGIGEGLHASPAVGNEEIYIGSVDGRIYGLRASTGERIWPYGIPTQGPVESVPTLEGGRVYFGSGDGRIYALDAETGGEYWHFSTPDAVYARPLAMGDQLIVASSGQVLVSIRLMDGKQVWRMGFNHPLTKPPVFFKNQLYLVTNGAPYLYAVDPQTGKSMGEVDTGDWIADGPLEAGPGILLVGQDGSVFLYR